MSKGRMSPWKMRLTITICNQILLEITLPHNLSRRCQILNFNFDTPIHAEEFVDLKMGTDYVSVDDEIETGSTDQ